ncbi:hypothetical protein T492DRAFT_832386 [Pavlovales sp. CCMP2436]|nr:hypothetical protein T492DRAFT_832386 [Pavlovales sp. CCMP2436]
MSVCVCVCVCVAGLLSADGGAGYTDAGGGAGGGVVLRSVLLTGSGTISARGGIGGSNSVAGSGGGGRLFLQRGGFGWRRAAFLSARRLAYDVSGGAGQHTAGAGTVFSVTECDRVWMHNHRPSSSSPPLLRD